MTHTCYCVTAHNAPLERMECPTPEPKGAEVLIRMTGAGLCHSDIHIWEGKYDLGSGNQMLLKDRGVSLPLTMGSGRTRPGDRRCAQAGVTPARAAPAPPRAAARKKARRSNKRFCTMLVLGLSMGLMKHLTGDHRIMKLSEGVRAASDDPSRAIKKSQIEVWRERELAASRRLFR